MSDVLAWTAIREDAAVFVQAVSPVFIVFAALYIATILINILFKVYGDMELKNELRKFSSSAVSGFNPHMGETHMGKMGTEIMKQIAEERKIKEKAMKEKKAQAKKKLNEIAQKEKEEKSSNE